MMKKKRRNFSMKKKAMGMMGMGMGMGTPAPHPVNNPILLLNSYPPFVETSVINQNTTVMEVKGSGIISRHFQAVATQFTLVVNILIYAPNTQLDPMAVFDTTPAAPDGSNPGGTRIYAPVFQFGFGKNANAYQHAMFYLNNVPPIDGTIELTVKHPPCLRRVVTLDQFANINSNNPLDQQAADQSSTAGLVEINSGQTGTTEQAFEMVYGSIAVGRDFDQFAEPDGFIPIQNVGSNIDTFDATLKTYYKLTAQTGQFDLSALVSGVKTTFVWSAAVQTFNAAQT